MQLTRGPDDNIPRIPPAIETWDFDMVKRREKKELERGGFGCFEEDGDQDLPEVVVREKTREVCIIIIMLVPFLYIILIT